LEYRKGEELEHDISEFVWLESNKNELLMDIVIQTDNEELAGLHML